MEKEESDDIKKSKVAIIGAGIAGLSVANHFVKNGMDDFIVLEATDKIGGRIQSVTIDGFKLELGANWIHGVLGNPMYEIAVMNGLVDIVQNPRPHKVVAANEEGKQVPFPLLQEIYEAYIVFLHRCEEYFLCEFLPPVGVESVGEHIELEIAMYLDSLENEQEKLIRRQIFDCLLKRETCITGCHSMCEIDIIELGSFTELQGGNISLPRGYSSILEPVSRDIPLDKILKCHEVAQIKWKVDTDDEEEISDTESDRSDKTVIDNEVAAINSVSLSREFSKKRRRKGANVELTCSNGNQFHCEHVICTLPLGVLQDCADKLFVPNLPESKKESINKLLFGTVNKIFLIYERPFLNPNITEIMLLWNLDPNSQDDIPEVWFKKIYSFSKISETVLLGWISGKEAVYAESLSDLVIADKCTEILRKFLNDPFIPKPKYCFCTKWNSNKYSKGSYTAVAVGSSQCDIENLSQPLYRNPKDITPTVLFAGEHTHSNFYSTVHGAYLTGRTCSQIILDSFEDNQDNQARAETPCTTDLSSWIQGISFAD